MVSGDFCTLNYHFVFLFFGQLSGNFLKITFFKKGCKIGFFNCLCFEMIFEQSRFVTLLKHYKIGFQSIFMFFVVEREEKEKQNDNWNFRIWVV